MKKIILFESGGGQGAAWWVQNILKLDDYTIQVEDSTDISIRVLDWDFLTFIIDHPGDVNFDAIELYVKQLEEALPSCSGETVITVSRYITGLKEAVKEAYRLLGEVENEDA